MSVLHMETDEVRSNVQRVQSALASIENDNHQVLQAMRSMAWSGSGRDQLVAQSESLARGVDQAVESGRTLLQRVSREVLDWEAAAAAKGGGASSPSPVFVVIGGAVIVGTGVFIYWLVNDDLQKLTDAEAYKKLSDILDDTSMGRNLLDEMKKRGVTFHKNAPGEGTYYHSGPPPEIYVDADSNVEQAADGLIHEMTHATQTFPDVNATSKEDYVNQCLQREAEATIAEYKYQKEKGIVVDTLLSLDPGEKTYWDSYNAKLADLKKSSPNLSTTDMERIAFEAGRQKLVDVCYKGGVYTTSTTGEDYQDYYGGYWEKANAPVPTSNFA